MVDAENDCRVDIFAARCGDDDFLGAAFDVGAGFFLGGEETGAFQHDVNAQLAPWQFGRITLRQYLDAIAIDDDEVAVDCHGTWKLAVGSIVLGQVRIGFWIAEVIDGNDLDVMLFAAFIMGAKDVAADTAIAIDGDADSHGFLLRY